MRSSGLSLQLLSQAANGHAQVANLLFAQKVDLLVQQFDLEFGLDVDFVIAVGMQAVNFRLPVLTHHDGRRCISRLKRKHQVQEDERVGVPGVWTSEGVPDDPGNDQKTLKNDEAP